MLLQKKKGFSFTSSGFLFGGLLSEFNEMLLGKGSSNKWAEI
jgi:hypothetical protein